MNSDIQSFQRTMAAYNIVASLSGMDTGIRFPEAEPLYAKKPDGPVQPTAGTVVPQMPYNRGISAELAEANKGETKTFEPEGLSLSERASLVTDGIGSLLEAGSIYSRGRFESKQLEIVARSLELNKKALRRDIKDIAFITGIQASNTLKQAAEMKGRQYAAQAESGFNVSETESFVVQRDYTDLLAQDQINQYAYEAAMAIEGKRNQIAAVEAEQAIKRAEAKYVKKTSQIAAGMQVIKGVASIAGGIYL